MCVSNYLSDIHRGLFLGSKLVIIYMKVVESCLDDSGDPDPSIILLDFNHHHLRWKMDNKHRGKELFVN